MKNKNPPETKIRVMLVDDHPVMREALRVIITSEPDLAVVAEAGGGRAAIDLLGCAKPDVILMDGSMPEMNGMETTRRLKQLQPDVKIIGLTLYEQTTYLEEMAAVGASGYILKTGAPKNVINAIRVVTAGGTYFDPAVPRRRVAAEQQRSTTGELTADELAIAKLLADGQTNAEIAASLGWNVPAVEIHRTTLMKKLGLRTRAELVRVASQRHWVDT